MSGAPGDRLAEEQAADVARSVMVDGTTTERFEPVRRAFVDNFTTGDEECASLAVYWNGERVVDLWGWDSRAARWPVSDSLYPLFSITKGLTAGVLTTLVQQRVIDLDTAVCHYWPAFGQNGKQYITVRQLASHQAGLPAFEERTTLDDLVDWDLCVTRLARQAPRWAPGRAHGYHTVTFGYLVGELIRRASTVPVGELFRQAIADQLGLDAWIGLPVQHNPRVIPIVHRTDPDQVPSTAALSPYTMDFLASVRDNPPVSTAGFNQPAMWAAEIPAVNGIADARSVASFFAALSSADGWLFSAATVRAMTREQVNGHDLVLRDQQSRFGVGFMLSHPREPMLGPASFGHLGRGGSLGFADPEHGIGYAYTSAYAVQDTVPDRRNTRIVSAVRACLPDPAQVGLVRQAGTVHGAGGAPAGAMSHDLG